MPLRAQRPAPPPPASGRQQAKKPNLNSGLIGLTSNDSNNNRQNGMFSWPTVIRASSSASNNNSVKQTKKKPPPRPAPPKNYHAARKPGESLSSPPPDLLADLADIFSAPPPVQKGARPLSHPFNQSSNQNLVSSASFFKNSSSSVSTSFSARPGLSSSFRPGSKKYPAPLPSKIKAPGEMSLIDFETPIGTAHLTPSDTLALATAVNNHKSLIDWDAGSVKPANQLSKSSSAFDLLDGSHFPPPMSSALAGSAASHIRQQASSSLTSQHRENLVSWGVNSVKQQTASREFSPPEPKFPPPPPPPSAMAEDDPFGEVEESDFHHNAVLEVCQAVYDFTAEKPGDLSLRVGDRVEVEAKQNKDWWTGRCNGRRGIFPAAFVQPDKSNSTPSQSEETSGCYAKALYTFVAEQATDLTFQEGETVQVLYRINQDWLFGRCRGREGQFPASFVSKINANANQDMCRALYAFQAENGDELNLCEGDRIVVVDRSGVDWWKGHLESDPRKRVGLFPVAFVEACS